ncbi:MAG: type III-B CRISPR module RAMP protein Cmr6 [Candidatus Hadarchaeales archaeon]
MNLFSYLQLASIVKNIKKVEEGGKISKEGKDLIEKIVKQLNTIEQKLNPPEKLKLRLEEIKTKNWAEADKHYLEFCVWYTTKNLPSAVQKLNELEDVLRKAGYETIRIDAKLEERGVFGTSQRFGRCLFEVGLEFDPYLNLPVVPGSSLKGAARSTYEILRSEHKDWPSPEEIFGSGGGTAQSGKAVFLDAYPVSPGRGKAILFPDVMTPHYKKKSGEDMFSEFGWEPRPITYLSVAPETTFRFLVGVVKNYKDILHQTLLETLELGLGAKTAVGYGRFRVEVEHVG